MEIRVYLSNVRLGQLFRFQSGNLNPYLRIRSGYLDIKSGKWIGTNSTNRNQLVILLTKSEVCNELNVTLDKLNTYIKNQLNYLK